MKARTQPKRKVDSQTAEVRIEAALQRRMASELVGSIWRAATAFSNMIRRRVTITAKETIAAITMVYVKDASRGGWLGLRNL